MGIINRVADFDSLADIGRRDFIEQALEAYGGIIIDDALMPYQKDFIEFGFREPSDLHGGHRGLIAVDGTLTYACVYLVMVLIIKPEPEGVIEFLQGKQSLESREEPFPDGSKESLHLATGRAVIGFGVDKGDPCHGTTSGQKIRTEAGSVVYVEPLRQPIGQEGFL